MQFIPADKTSELRTLKGLVIDMDGVLWQGDTPLPGLHEFFEVLKSHQIKFILATNNNTQTPDGFVQKARKLGVDESPDLVVTASVAQEALSLGAAAEIERFMASVLESL